MTKAIPVVIATPAWAIAVRVVVVTVVVRASIRAISVPLTRANAVVIAAAVVAKTAVTVAVVVVARAIIAALTVHATTTIAHTAAVSVHTVVGAVPVPILRKLLKGHAIAHASAPVIIPAVGARVTIHVAIAHVSVVSGPVAIIAITHHHLELASAGFEKGSVNCLVGLCGRFLERA